MPPSLPTLLEPFARCLAKLYPEEAVRAAAEAGDTTRRRLFDVSDTPHPDNQFYAVTNGRPTIYPHAKQRRVLESSYRFTLALAGVRSGKTSIGPWWLCNRMQDHGPGVYLLVAPTFVLLDRAAVPDLRVALGRILGLGEVIGGAKGFFLISDAGHRKLWPDLPLPMEPSRIIFGYAERPESLAAVTAKDAWLDECGQKGFKQESFEELQARVSISQGHILFTTRPYYVQHWLKSEVYDRAERRAKGEGEPPDRDYEVIKYESRDNPTFKAEEWARAEATMPAWKFSMIYRGVFTRPVGAVYDCWEPERMVGDPPKLDPSWKRYIGIDFGAPNFAAVFIAEDPGEEIPGPPLPGMKKLTTSRLHVYAEYRPEESRTAAAHIAAIKAIEPGPATVIGGSFSENQWRLDFGHEGLTILRPDQPEVEIGLMRAYAVIKMGKLMVGRNCPKLIADLNGYSRPVDEAGNVLEGLEDKETWHSADAFRYAMTYICRKGSPWHIEFVRAEAKRGPAW